MEKNVKGKIVEKIEHNDFADEEYINIIFSDGTSLTINSCALSEGKSVITLDYNR